MTGRLSHGWQSDWRQTRRSLWHSPRHAATVVLCLGAGIAVNVTALSMINSLFYGDIAGVHERTSLVRVFLGYTEALAAERMGRVEGRVLADELSQLDFRSLSASVPPY